MADSTNAERQRRFRAHHKGDHSLCLPASCAEAVPPEPPEPPPAAMPAPSDEEWGPGGAQLWRDLEKATPKTHRALLREACRIVDRLDRMDGILQRKNDWLRVNTMDFGENVKVKITMDGVLAEARQQAVTVLALIKELQGVAKEEPKTTPKTGGLGDLSARIAARRGSSAG